MEEEMRLDKFLKVSRVIKRRTVAEEACRTGHVEVNGKVAKPGSRVEVGDVVTVRFGESVTKFKILKIAQTMGKDAADSMYQLL